MSKEKISASRRVARLRVILLSLLMTIVVVVGMLYYKSEQIILGRNVTSLATRWLLKTSAMNALGACQ